MFEGIKGFFRKVGIKLGLIKQLESVTDHKKVSVPESFYNKIIEWRELHRGYNQDMHQLTYQTIDGQKTRDIATMNMPKVAVQELSTLIFNERCDISVSDEAYNEFIQDVFKQNRFNGTFQQQLEFMFAQGGLAIKPYVENGAMKLAYATADCFLPISWSNTGIREGLFVSEIHHQGKKYNHFEWHLFEDNKYVIVNELYETTNGTNLGTKVNLSILFPELQERVEISNVDRPLFVYLKPNIANNIEPTVPLGVSVFANAYDTLKSIDIAYDSLQREFRLGRSRIIVPESAIKTVVDPVTNTIKRYFDPTDETYEAFNTGNMDDSSINVVTTPLRVTEHIDAINALLNVFAMQMGFSAGSFSFNGQSVKTATEVVSENSKTFRTKQSHENVIEQGITDLIEVIGIVAQLYGLYTPPMDYEVTVTFDDSIAQDRTADIQEQILLCNAGLQAKVDAIRILHGLTEEEAVLKYKKIKEEELANAPEFSQVQKSVSFGGAEE